MKEDRLHIIKENVVEDKTKGRTFEEVPFGIIETTCDKYPRVTFINKAMSDGATANGVKEIENILDESLYLLLPFDSRAYLSEQLKKADKTSRPVLLKHRIEDASGCMMFVSGWVYRKKGAVPDKDRYVFMYVREGKDQLKQESVTEHSYFRALESAYNIIFEISNKNNTVDCIYGRDTSSIGSTFDITMTVDSARAYWLNNFILPEDRDMAADFFQRIAFQKGIREEKRPLQMEVGLKLADGSVVHYLAVAVQLDNDAILLCCRDISGVKYIDKPAADADASQRVFIRTFGYFDVFAGDTPLVFSSDKEKELLALLVDRNGGTVTSESAITYLWEDEPISEKIRAAYRKVAMGLKKTLSSYGLDDIVINNRGVRSLDTSKVKCDYYEMLKGHEKYRSLFHGMYMTDYTWAEETLAMLFDLE